MICYIHTELVPCIAGSDGTSWLTNLLDQLSMSVRLIAAMKKDINRKPAKGMWELLQKSINGKIGKSYLGMFVGFDRQLNRNGPYTDLEESFYIGDAAGRAEGWKPKAKKDHSCGDRKFADNIGIRFQTPEEYFFNEPPIKFSWGGFDPKQMGSEGMCVNWVFTKCCPPPLIHYVSFVGALFSPADTPLVPEDGHQEVILFVGYPASGKSTFAHKHLVPKGYVYINQVMLRS